jgi:hypothetical protein
VCAMQKPGWFECQQTKLRSNWSRSSGIPKSPTGERWRPIQRELKRRSRKDAGAVVPHKYSMLKVQSNRIGEGRAFHIATFTHKVFDFVAMTHGRDALGNERQ